MRNTAYITGVDNGTNCVRSVIINAADEKSGLFSIILFTMERKKVLRSSIKSVGQQQLDYIKGLESNTKACIQAAGPAVAGNIQSLSVDNRIHAGRG